jgi:hypothetical protein
MLTNISSMGVGPSWATCGDYTVTFTAYNTDHPDGVSTNLVVHVAPIRPMLTPGTLTSGGFTLSFTAQQNATYVVEQTGDLTPPVVWQPVTTVNGQGAPVQVTDGQAINAARFYRVRTH